MARAFTVETKEGIATVTFDLPGEKVNILKETILAEFEKVLAGLEAYTAFAERSNCWPTTKAPNRPQPVARHSITKALWFVLLPYVPLPVDRSTNMPRKWPADWTTLPE